MAIPADRTDFAGKTTTASSADFKPEDQSLDLSNGKDIAKTLIDFRRGIEVYFSADDVTHLCDTYLKSLMSRLFSK